LPNLIYPSLPLPTKKRIDEKEQIRHPIIYVVAYYPAMEYFRF